MDFENAQVLVIELSETDPRLKPCYIKKRQLLNGSYKRVDDKDIKLSPTEIYALQNLLKPSRADKAVVEDASMSDLDNSLIEKLIERKRRQNSKALRGVSGKNQQLERLGVLNSSGEVLLGGLLSAGYYPQQFYPKLVVDVAVHPGIEKSTPNQPRFLDRVICEGSIGEMIQDSVKAVVRNLRNVSIIEGAGRKDVPEIPEEVLREAIANALIHREYSEWYLGQSVSVDIYSDRVEILNPGGLWGGKTLENIGDGTSRCRNANLMNLLENIPLPDGEALPAEGEGSGISYMIREMKSRALMPPQFDADIDSFKVTFGRSGIEIKENRTWLNKISDDALTRHQEAILLQIKSKGELSVRDLRDAMGVDSDDIREALVSLVNCGYLKEDNGKYSLIAKEYRPYSSRSNIRKKIVTVLSDGKPRKAKDLSEELGEKLSTIRYYLPLLIAEGKVVATEKTNSPKRKYKINSEE